MINPIQYKWGLFMIYLVKERESHMNSINPMNNLKCFKRLETEIALTTEVFYSRLMYYYVNANKVDGLKGSAVG
jgi:hypothetical protein